MRDAEPAAVRVFRSLDDQPRERPRLYLRWDGSGAPVAAWSVYESFEVRRHGRTWSVSDRGFLVVGADGELRPVPATVFGALFREARPDELPTQPWVENEPEDPDA